MNFLPLLLVAGGTGVAAERARSTSSVEWLAGVVAAGVAGVALLGVPGLVAAGVGAAAGAHISQMAENDRVDREAQARIEAQRQVALLAQQQAATTPAGPGLKPGVAKLVSAPLMFIPGVGPVAAAVTSAVLSRRS